MNKHTTGPWATAGSYVHNAHVGATPLNEPILADDYTVYADRTYVADGEVVVSDWHGVTVREFKMRLGAKEIRRCDLIGRSMLVEFV